MIDWHAVKAIIAKDWAVERRTWQTLVETIVFGIIAIVTFNFALSIDLGAARSVALGLFWVIVWLSGTLTLNRSFLAETEHGALSALKIAPIQPSSIFFGKWISLVSSLFLSELILVPLFVLFLGQPLFQPGILLTIFFATIGYVAAGVFVASMAVQTRASYILLPILLLPLTLPLVLSASFVSAEFLTPNPDWNTIQLWGTLIIIYDLLMAITGLFFYNYLLEE